MNGQCRTGIYPFQLLRNLSTISKNWYLDKDSPIYYPFVLNRIRSFKGQFLCLFDYGPGILFSTISRGHQIYIKFQYFVVHEDVMFSCSALLEYSTVLFTLSASNSFINVSLIDHISHVPPGKFPIIIYLHPAGYGHRILLKGLNFRLKVTKLS